MNNLILIIGFLCCINLPAQIPENLTQCNNYLDKKISEEDKVHLKNLKENELSSLHFSLGLYIRNSWLRNEDFKKLNDYFSKLGLFHYDDISGTIIKNYWYYLHDKRLNVRAEVKKYQEYWEKVRIRDIENKKNLKKTETLIYNNFKELNVVDKDVPTIEIPQKDFSVFCVDFIKYGKGIIINSLNTAPGGSDVIQYRYYYTDSTLNDIKKIYSNKLDTIESIVVKNKSLYLSGKKDNKNHIIKYVNGKDTSITTPPMNNIKNSAFYNWIKLGFYKDKLLALTCMGVYTYENEKWNSIFTYNLDEFNRKHGIRTIIPTENIRIINDKLYFVQEMVQGRDSNLIVIDLKNKSIEEIFNKLGIIDNYSKEVVSYNVNQNNHLNFIGERLMNENLFFKIKNDTFQTIVFNNKIKNNADFEIRPRLVIDKDDYELIIAENGIFKLKDNLITPLVKIDNQDKRFNYYYCLFQMRSYLELSPNSLLLGGMYGGLVKIDLNNFETTWLFKNREINGVSNKIDTTEITEIIDK